MVHLLTKIPKREQRFQKIHNYNYIFVMFLFSVSNLDIKYALCTYTFKKTNLTDLIIQYDTLGYMPPHLPVLS